MIKLVNSGVEFNDELHTYMLGGKVLRGITGMIREQLFPDEYKDIPKYILDHAADRGTKVHNLCETFDANERQGVFTPPSQVVTAYKLLRKDFTPVANEYTVTDGTDFASNIDCVWTDKDGGIVLADIKTPKQLNIDYVSWQLSIYKWMFELQNFPDLRVSRLYAVRIVADDDFNVTHSELVEVEYKGDEAVCELLACARRGEQYMGIPQKAEKNVPVLAQDAIEMLIEAEAELKKWQQQYDDIKSAALAAMKKHGLKSWDCEQLKMTYVPEGSSQRFDSAAFKKDHPDLYAQYMKEINTKESIRITIR